MGKKAPPKQRPTAASDPTEQYLVAFEAKQRFISSVLNMGWRLAVTFLIPVVIGAWLDNRFNASPSYTITGLFIGIFGGVMVVTGTVKEVNADMAAADKLTKKPKRSKHA